MVTGVSLATKGIITKWSPEPGGGEGSGGDFADTPRRPILSVTLQSQSDESIEIKTKEMREEDDIH